MSKRRTSRRQAGLHGFTTSYERIAQLLAESNARITPVHTGNTALRGVGIGRPLLSQDVVDASLEQLRDLGFTVQPCENQPFVQYASMARLKASGFSDAETALESYRDHGISNPEILDRSRAAALTMFSFVKGTGDVIRGARLLGGWSKAEKSSFSQYFTGEEPPLGSICGITGLYAKLGRIEMPNDAEGYFATTRMMEDFRAAQSDSTAPQADVELGRMQVIYSAS
ncbi:MAG TPA: hypothetical protein VLG11_02325 [Candidatus Saccharimonadales bacterium]|nr:hypothetical protein [Candidatus Saccharimonadales bacterium]